MDPPIPFLIANTPNCVRQCVLILVAFHPSAEEVERLQQCVAGLSERIGHVVVANDHRVGEPVDALASSALFFLANDDNPGYGRAINQAVRALQALGPIPPYLAALNTDLSWCAGSFEAMLDWLETHPDVALAVPQLLNPAGVCQRLCKRHPTLLALFSRRFMAERLKPAWLRRYDRRYEMAEHNYDEVFDVPYLSGCCMLMRTELFLAVGGFDEHFFLYLEDADLTRTLASKGRTVHLPVACVTHHWGRGNHHSKRLTLVNIRSVWVYFRKWGWRFS